MTIWNLILSYSWRPVVAYLADVAASYRSAKAAGTMLPWYQILRRVIALVVLRVLGVITFVVALLGFGLEDAKDVWRDLP